MAKFYFTFGFGQPHEGGYHVIEAEDSGEARWRMFERFQLNFHAEHHPVDDKKFSEVLRQYLTSKPIIFQMDGTNEKIFYSNCYR
ncbi:MAG: hypothetical protein QQN64_08195 [Nitrosopumilus sp.]